MKVLTWPNEILTKVATSVPHGQKVRETIDLMFDAMDYPNGIGLAAPQVGLDMRIICIHVPAIKKNQMVSGSTKIAIINPELVWWKGGPDLAYEGCLSFPDERVLVPRFQRVKVKGFDVKWNPITFGGKALIARVLQHEIDHLNGRTLDYYDQMAKEIEAARESDDPTSSSEVKD